MKALYYLFRICSTFISLMPFGMIRFFSDILAFKLQYIFRYRLKVIRTNLRNSFPEKSEKEFRQIIHRYYRNLAEVIFEVIKSERMSHGQIAERMKIRNPEILTRLYDEGKSCIVAIGHCGNWEWMPKVLDYYSKYRIFGIVKPLSNKDFDNYMTLIRKKGTKDGALIPFKSTFRELVKVRNELVLAVMAGDQTPTRSEIQHWVRFLNQDTPVFLGIERISKALKHAVLYVDMQRVGRSRYEVEIREISRNPEDTEEYSIIESYMKMLEESIRKNPDNWLWSHRRWKHKKNDASAQTEKY